jgi:hypothetical protein
MNSKFIKGHCLRVLAQNPVESLCLQPGFSAALPLSNTTLRENSDWSFLPVLFMLKLSELIFSVCKIKSSNSG